MSSSTQRKKEFMARQIAAGRKRREVWASDDEWSRLQQFLRSLRDDPAHTNTIPDSSCSS